MSVKSEKFYPAPPTLSVGLVGCLELLVVYEHSEQARAPHTNGPRDVPRCGALSSSLKDAALQGGMMVVLRPLFAAALVVCRRYFIVAPSPFPAAQLVVHRR